MSTEAVLRVLALRNAPGVDAVERFAAAKERIAAQRFNSERTAEELAAAKRICVDELRTAAAQAIFTIDREEEHALTAFDAAAEQRARDRRELRDSDLTALRTSSDVADLLRIVAEADTLGPQVAERARKLAETRLRTLASEDNKAHRINGRPFRALCEITQTAKRGSTRDDVVERYRQRRADVANLARQVAEVAGLADAMRIAALRADAPPATQSAKFRVGPAFDRLSEAARDRK